MNYPRALPLQKKPNQPALTTKTTSKVKTQTNTIPPMLIAKPITIPQPKSFRDQNQYTSTSQVLTAVHPTSDCVAGPVEENQYSKFLANENVQSKLNKLYNYRCFSI